MEQDDSPLSVYGMLERIRTMRWRGAGPACVLVLVGGISLWMGTSKAAPPTLADEPAGDAPLVLPPLRAPTTLPLPQEDLDPPLVLPPLKARHEPAPKEDARGVVGRKVSLQKEQKDPPEKTLP